MTAGSVEGATTAVVLGLATALGGGLLIGLERERRKGRGGDRQAAGIRSFALAALGGGLAQASGQPLLVGAGALMVLALAAVAYRASRTRTDRPRSADPGLTTELALFVTYLTGVLSVQDPPLGAGAAAVVATLLAARERLHRFATRVLSEAELHDALMLAALALVALPLLPAEPWPLLGGLKPRTVGLLAVLILLLQGAGHAAHRLFGAAAGLALSGFMSGFVSSTATIASMGARVRAEPGVRPACEAGAILSTAATWVLAMVMLAAVSPALAWAVAPPALAGFGAAAATGAWRERRAVGLPAPLSRGGPLRVREAAVVALLLGGVTLGVGWAQRQWGTQGLLVGALLAALGDAHSSITALGAMHASNRVPTAEAVPAVLAAVTANSVTRSITAFVAGGRAFGLRVAGSLVLSCGAAWALHRAF